MTPREPKLVEGPGGAEIQAVRNGKPVWACPRCRSEVWGRRAADCGCDNTPVKLRRTVLLACSARGARVGAVGCCEVVYACSVHSLCTVNAAAGTIQGYTPHCCANCQEINP